MAKKTALTITGGLWKRTHVISHDIDILRPTQNIARQAICNMIASHKKFGSFTGLTIADIGAGTGIMGLEMLSRGAQFVYFVEKESSLCAIIRRNVNNVGCSDASYHVEQADITHYMPPLPLCDVIFMDLPYSFNAYQPLLATLRPYVHELGIIIIQCAPSMAIEISGDYAIQEQRKIGNGLFYFLTII